MRKPQVIEDQAHERVFQRVAAVDVAKASGMVCTRMPNPLDEAFSLVNGKSDQP